MIELGMLEPVIKMIEHISDGEPMVKAAIAAMLTGMVGAAVTVILVKIPVRIFNSIKAQATVCFSLTDRQWPECETLKLIEIEALKNSSSFGSRSFSISAIETGEDKNTRMSIGVGNHLVFYKRRPIIIKREFFGDSTTPYTKLTITTLGRSRATLESFLYGIIKNKDKTPKMFDYTKDWQPTGGIPKSNLDSLCLSEKTRGYFVRSIESFLYSRTEYERLGIPYKETFMLHGDPGTGKTSIIRSLAYTYGFNIATINLGSQSDDSLMRAMASVPEKTMVVFEDVDSAGSMKTRNQEAEHGDLDSILGCSIYGVLNALDGITPLNNVIVFLTTNHINKIDPAILRPGRTDHMIELPRIPKEEVNEYMGRLYSTSGFNAKGSMRACEIAHVKQAAKFSAELAVEMINSGQTTNDVKLDLRGGQ